MAKTKRIDRLEKPLPQRVADDILFVLKQIDELRRGSKPVPARKDEDESA
jgi:hypothetical protein